MTRNMNGHGYDLGLGRANGRGMGGRGNGQCRRDGTGFGSGSAQGQRRCQFEAGDGRWGLPARSPMGFHPFAGAISRIEAAINDLKRQINELRQKP